MKRRIIMTMAAAWVFWLMVPGTASAKLVLKLATVTPAHHAYTDGAHKFARLVDACSDGEIEIKVYPGGQLGKGERELIEGLQVGTIDMAISSTGPVSNFVPDIGVVDLPFLFVNTAHVDRVLGGDVGRGLLDGLESARIKGLAFFENGFRNFTNSKRPLLKPADFKGLKFRTMENPVHLATVRQLGAQATPMSWGEVYTSLQTGVIDGQENPVAIIHAYKMVEVQKYLSLTGHFYSPSFLMMSLGKFKSLKPEQQKCLLDSAAKAAVFERALIRDNEMKQLKDIKDWGMEISEVDKKLFINAMKPVYDKFFAQYPGWKPIVEKIQSQAQSPR